MARNTAELLSVNVRRWRKERDLSLAELSSRVAALGVHLGLNALSKVELGNRGLGLDELMALARALRVPPLLLVFPLGKDETVEVLPGTVMDTWTAAKWFTGEEAVLAWPGGDPVPDELDEGPAATAWFRDHDKLLSEWAAARQELNQAQSRAGRTGSEELRDPDVRSALAVLRNVELDLRNHRATMRRLGLTPPALSPHLAHVDQGGTPGGER
jgi:transcriptional regulator with XRE-family HTH domain